MSRSIRQSVSTPSMCVLDFRSKKSPRRLGSRSTRCARMNPQYLSGRTPPSATLPSDVKWPLRVPRGTGRKATSAMLDSATRAKTTAYVVRTGDTVDSVATRCRTNLDQLGVLNTLGENENLKPGAVLLCPVLATGLSFAPDVEDVVAVPSKDFQLPLSQARILPRHVGG